MFPAHSFVSKIQKKYPVPPEYQMHFDGNDIRRFESELGYELPSDFYEYLKIYGNGSFSEYFYIWGPFGKGGTKGFLEETAQQKEIYADLENSLESSPDHTTFVDARFSGSELVLLNGNRELAEYLRVERIDEHTRSKILAFGDHYPYAFYPEKNGLLYFGRTDDEDFFVRIHDQKTSIVMYRGDYYEFDMGITEFIYEYLSRTIRLPMMGDDDEWDFVPYAPRA